MGIVSEHKTTTLAMVVRATSLSIFLLCLSACITGSLAQEGHDGHDHGSGEPFEWKGIFATPGSKYIWSAQAVGGGELSYVDPSMRMVALPAKAATEAELLALVPKAKELLEGTCDTVESGGTIAPDEKTCFLLQFQKSTLDSFYYITPSTAGVAFFTEHMPTEFERSEHYFKDAAGNDVEPTAQAPDPSEEVKPSKPWGVAIGAAIIVNLVTLVGVVLTIPVIREAVNRYKVEFGVATNAFAAGALLAAAFYLLLFEATHLVTADTEALAAARWGSMILFGFLASFLVDLVLAFFFASKEGEGHDHVKQTAQAQEATFPLHAAPIPMQPPNLGQFPGQPIFGRAFGTVPADSFPDGKDDEWTSTPSRQRRILSGILTGDFMHNFCDGCFIGSAFHLCGESMGWSVTAATVYHEIAQEISDYVVLTDPEQGRLQPWMALSLNFLSGLSVILGVLVILAQDMSNLDVGMILAFGGGVYLQIGAGECMPRVYQSAKTIPLRCLGVFAFFLGALAIGLVLLDHLHCTAGGGHDGHNH